MTIEKSKVKSFIDYIRQELQDDQEAADEIGCLAEEQGANYVQEMEKRFEIDLSQFGSNAYIHQLAVVAVENYIYN